MVSEIVGLSDRFAVMSEFAAERVRLDVAADAAGHVVVVPFAMHDAVPDPAPAADRAPLVASFGVVHPRQAERVARRRAAVDPRTCAGGVARVRRTVFGAGARRPSALAVALDVGDRVTVTGVVAAAEYAAWLDRAAVAVQLRRTANGESSAAVADCLGAGAAVVVTGIGAARELPPDAVVAVSSAIASTELGAVIGELLVDPARARRARATRAARSSARNSFAAAARRFYDDVIAPAAVSGLSRGASRVTRELSRRIRTRRCRTARRSVAARRRTSSMIERGVGEPAQSTSS